MKPLVDVVNFNADASCLSSAAWLNALKGGGDSQMCRWLSAYVDARRRVVLGFTGATVADLAILNPEAIRFVNDHPSHFEVLLRPFAHDIGLLRTPVGFALNFKLGQTTILREFARVAEYFLPPEFMLTNAQVTHLAQSGVRGTFVNPVRYKPDLRTRIPVRPYLVHGTNSSTLRCIPMRGELVDEYLRAIHLWDCSTWNRGVAESADEVCVSWRDGESFLLVPKGVEREAAWLRAESGRDRAFLSEAEQAMTFSPVEEETAYKSYPVCSFADWMKEFRMLGYLTRLANLERQLETLDTAGRVLWLQTINSDVLSSVEKDSPVICLRTMPADSDASDDVSWTIHRSERGYEGEDFLEMLEASLSHGPNGNGRGLPHMEKLRSRQEYVSRIAD